MDCILLGTGGMMPMPNRFLTSLAVRLNGQIYLFDAGEATQIGWKRAHLGIKGLNVIAVSHLHADHCLGLPGLMMLKAQMESPAPLTILGPPGIEEFVRRIQEILQFFTNYAVFFNEWSEDSPDLAYDDGQVRVLWRPLKHTRFCLGYRIEEVERPGKFDPVRARLLDIPEGPLWGKLQSGESILLTDGKEIKPDCVMGPLRRGRHVAYVVDTRPIEAVCQLCRNVEIAFIEGMFLPVDGAHACAKGHLTVAEAAGIVKRSGAARAVLVHLSPRYLDEDLDLIEKVAQDQFSDVVVGRDLAIYPVELPE